MRHGFTLIELLVVITIIVVLLAVLAPALDKAIEEAEMTLCGAHTRVLAQGALGYALDHSKLYPGRAAVNTAQQPIDVSHNATNGNDDRPQYGGYIAMGLNGPFNCPLNGKVDIEGSQADTWILAPYGHYWGWRYKTLDGRWLPGMRRMGDRFRWEHPSAGQPVTYDFDVLACDDSLVIVSDNWGHGTHPDREGKWVQLVYQDQGIIVPTAIAGTAGLKATFARFSGPPRDRGVVDLSFAFQDGSVRRINNIDYRAGQADDPDASERIVAVPYTSQTGEDANYFRQLPKP